MKNILVLAIIIGILAAVSYDRFDIAIFFMLAWLNMSLPHRHRCKDCTYAEKIDGYPLYYCKENDRYTDADGFCSWHEKK